MACGASACILPTTEGCDWSEPGAQLFTFPERLEGLLATGHGQLHHHHLGLQAQQQGLTGVTVLGSGTTLQRFDAQQRLLIPNSFTGSINALRASLGQSKG